MIERLFILHGFMLTALVAQILGSVDWAGGRSSPLAAAVQRTPLHWQYADELPGPGKAVMIELESANVTEVFTGFRALFSVLIPNHVRGRFGGIIVTRSEAWWYRMESRFLSVLV